MKRREFITLLGGAGAWPLVARAQQSERVRRVGVLQTPSESDPQTQTRVEAFEQALRRLGWTIGDNLRIDYRFGAAGDVERIRRYAAELVALGPDVIVVVGTANVAPLLQATRTVPIVFAFVADPVGAGLVESLARPGGQMTGFLQFEYGLSAKWLELIKPLRAVHSRCPLWVKSPWPRTRNANKRSKVNVGTTHISMAAIASA
jgi:ABC-type uncharacterized transport system substrate-binding protein